MTLLFLKNDSNTFICFSLNASLQNKGRYLDRRAVEGITFNLSDDYYKPRSYFHIAKIHHRVPRQEGKNKN